MADIVGQTDRATVLQGGTIVDGGGDPSYRGDVRFEGGTIVDIGEVSKHDAEVVDVEGLFVAPGFIDPHTHFDAQVLWDPELSPSTWHGVTTVVMGNCGFGIAPTRPEHRDLICRTLENVEGMAIEALEAGIDWSFESFPEYLDLLDRKPLRANVAALVGHTPLRLWVMGREASERAARPDEVAAIQQLAVEALRAGAVGVATSRGRNHAGAYGAPVPSRMASREELDALASALRDVGTGIFQAVAGPDLETPERFSEVASIAGRPVSWIPLFTDGETIARLDRTAELLGDVWPQMACRPIVTQVTMANPAMFMVLPSFERVLALPVQERASVYRDAAWRDVARVEAEHRWSARWDKLRVKESLRHAELIDGPSLAALGAELGCSPFDVMLDLSLDDELQTRFELLASNDDENELADLLRDPRALLGLSDAGAHARELCDACYPSHLLGVWVRERGVLTWEQAVWRLTQHPAQVFGLKGKGLLERGADADIVAFDPTSVACLPPERVHDLPAGADRLVVQSRGIDHMWVAGRRTRTAGRPLDDAHFGRVIRSHP